MDSFNVKTDFKCYKVLQGTTFVWKKQNIQQEFVLHAFKSDHELRDELCNSYNKMFVLYSDMLRPDLKNQCDFEILH